MRNEQPQDALLDHMAARVVSILGLPEKRETEVAEALTLIREELEVWTMPRRRVSPSSNEQPPERIWIDWPRKQADDAWFWTNSEYANTGYHRDDLCRAEEGACWTPVEVELPPSSGLVLVWLLECDLHQAMSTSMRFESIIMSLDYCKRRGISHWHSLRAPVELAALPHPYHCSCGAACTAEEYIDHLLKGHDAALRGVGVKPDAECLGCVASHLGYTNQNDRHTCKESGRVSVSPESEDAQTDGMEHGGGKSMRPLDALHGPIPAVKCTRCGHDGKLSRGICIVKTGFNYAKGHISICGCSCTSPADGPTDEVGAAELSAMLIELRRRYPDKRIEIDPPNPDLVSAKGDPLKWAICVGRQEFEGATLSEAMNAVRKWREQAMKGSDR